MIGLDLQHLSNKRVNRISLHIESKNNNIEEEYIIIALIINVAVSLINVY